MLQAIKNLNGPTRGNLGKNLAVFRRKNVKFHGNGKTQIAGLVFNPAHENLVEFLDECQKLAKDAFRIGAHAITEHFIYAKMAPRLKKSKFQAHLENSTFEQILTHLKRELELNNFELITFMTLDHPRFTI